MEIRATLFGGTRFALRKSTGGLRPIVTGYYWRRLAAKCANAYVAPKAATYLAPKQVRVGVAGGSEAAAHATRRFLVKLDFFTAFNKDQMLYALYAVLPEIAVFCSLA